MLRVSHHSFHDANSSAVRLKANCPPSWVQSSSQCCIGVLVGEVVFGGVAHDRGRRQAVPLPFQAAIDAPAQDRRPFGLEFVGQLRVALLVVLAFPRLRADELKPSIVTQSGVQQGA
jgi:hypothetical protein